jgi:exonuclease SbcD
MAFTFIHAADIHLDSPLHGLQQYPGAPVDAIRGAARKALERLVNLAIDRKIDFVIIAGDLYDGDWRDYNTGLFFVQQARRLQAAGIPLYLISGNHDAQSQITKSLVLPENTRMLSVDQAETIHIEDLGVSIHGQGFAKREVLEDLSLRYPSATKGHFNIGVLHTSAAGAEGHEPYAPCKIEGLQTRGYDYWALGHIHKREILREKPLVTFSGNIQGRHARETGPKGCWLVSVDDRHRITPQFEPLDVLRWEVAEIDVSDLTVLDDVHSEVARRAREVEQAADGRPLALRVVLRGMTELHDQFVAVRDRHVNNIRAIAGGERVWIEKVKFETQRPRSRAASDVDGALPWEDLLSCVTELRSQAPDPAAVAPEIGDLFNKLPADLDLQSVGLSLKESSDWESLLGEVESLLLGRLSGSEVEE